MAKKKEINAKFLKSGKRCNPDSYSSDNHRPIWVFDKLDKNGSFRFDISSEDFGHKDFLDKMILYSNMTWAEIKRQTHDANKSKHHFLQLEKLSEEALERVRFYEYDKIYPNSLFSFALNNLTRVIGIRTDEFFHIVWYDKYHKFCPSKLKHT